MTTGEFRDFEFYCPTRFVFGRGAVDAVGASLTGAGFARVMLVYGQGSVVRTGTLDRVRALLADAGITPVAELAGVRPNPEVASVREGIALAREADVDLVLAVGGGSVIDAAKAVAFGVYYDGDVWDIFLKKAPITDALAVASVLTIPAAGSEASASCVISNDEQSRKLGVGSDVFRPRFAFMDPELTFTLPPYQTAAGVTDMIAHILERFFSGVGDVEVTDRVSAGIIRTLMDVAPKVMEDPTNYDARANIMWSGMLAHNDLCGCGRSLNPTARAGGWESHGLEHELSAHHPHIAHGAGLAVMMPAWMRYVWQEDPARFLAFAHLVFGMEPAGDDDASVAACVEGAIDALQDFFASLGMPRHLNEFDLTREDVDALLPTLAASKGEVFGIFKRLTMDDARAIYLSAFA